MKITVEKRSSDYIAYVSNNPYIWECGETEVIAIGKLMVALSLYNMIDIEYKS